MNNPVPACRAIRVLAFRGDRSHAFATAFLRALDDEKGGRGPGPTALDCLLFIGHAGLSTDGGSTAYGFNPDPGRLPVWQLTDRLRNGDALPGIVTDDTAAFSAAQRRGMAIRWVDVILPEPRFQELVSRLDGERGKSQYTYGFPNGNGDCNCITWLERLGLPLLTGRMDEFIGLPGPAVLPSRRFGECV